MALLNREKQAAVLQLPIGEITPSPHQTRRDFHEEELAALAQSIDRSGLLNPISVRALPQGGYCLIAGERRWRACQMLGWSRIPALVWQKDDADAAALTLAENLHRSDLHGVVRVDHEHQAQRPQRPDQARVAVEAPHDRGGEEDGKVEDKRDRQAHPEHRREVTLVGLGRLHQGSVEPRLHHDIAQVHEDQHHRKRPEGLRGEEAGHDDLDDKLDELVAPTLEKLPQERGDNPVPGPILHAFAPVPAGRERGFP